MRSDSMVERNIGTFLPHYRLLYKINKFDCIKDI